MNGEKHLKESLFPDWVPPNAPIPRKGHAGIPGTGPEGETCKSCKHYAIKKLAKAYRKCGLMRDKWTGGGGTDIRAKDPACKEWDAAPPKPPKRKKQMPERAGMALKHLKKIKKMVESSPALTHEGLTKQIALLKEVDAAIAAVMGAFMSGEASGHGFAAGDTVILSVDPPVRKKLIVNKVVSFEA